MPQTITYEVYLDANDLMRRITFEIGGLEAEMNATDWNEPVDIKGPDWSPAPAVVGGRWLSAVIAPSVHGDERTAFVA